MHEKAELRNIIRERLDDVAARINVALRGKKLKSLEPVLTRIGRGKRLPHWFQKLKADGVLPNLDGKTIGSVVEMLLVAVLETSTLRDSIDFPLRVNPARGIDLPDIDLGVKSPSENYCTSEPFFSAYHRLLGSECDILVLLTDYQTAKDRPPLRLQIIKWRYLTKSQVADQGLCRLARLHRDWLLEENEAWAKKLFRFLAYVNQSDWQARHLIRLIPEMRDQSQVELRVNAAIADFHTKNQEAIARDRITIPEGDLEGLTKILKVTPCHLGVLDSADNWVIERLKDAARAPSDFEWQQLRSSALDGLIGMSFALQWRYNFGSLFGAEGCSPP